MQPTSEVEDSAKVIEGWSQSGKGANSTKMQNHRTKILVQTGSMPHSQPARERSVLDISIGKHGMLYQNGERGKGRKRRKEN